MLVIPCVIVLMSVGEVFAVTSEDDGRPIIESDKCTLYDTKEGIWEAMCNITAPKDLAIGIRYGMIIVECYKVNNSISLRKYFPDIRLPSNYALTYLEIKDCSNLSYAEVISKITIRNRSEEGGSTNITVFGRQVSLTDQQMSLMQSVEYLGLINNNIRSINSEDFSHLRELNILSIEDCCFEFESKAIVGLNKLLNLELKGSNITLSPHIFDELISLQTFRYLYNTISLIPGNLFDNNKALNSLSIRYNFQLKTLPEELVSNHPFVVTLELNNNGLERLPSNLLRNCARLKTIDLSNNNLKEISGDIFTGVTSLIVLNLGINSFAHLPRGLFQNQRNLLDLDLSYNKLDNVVPVLEVLLEHNQNLEKLNLAGNGMQIPVELLKSLQEQKRLDALSISIGGNRLECDCDNVTFISGLISSGKFTDAKRITCNDGKSFSNVSLYSVCGYARFYIIITVAACAPIMLLFAAIALYLKYKTYVKVFLYSRGCCLRWITEEELDKDKKYDVFIAFSHKDEAFVMNELVNRIEGPLHERKVCVHYRDWFAGEIISQQIVESIKNSKRTILVLTPDFLNSKWSKFEFRIAHYNTLKERRTRLIALIYKDIGDVEDIDDELKAYLRTNTYVEWGDPWFWEKLNYALPHPSTNNTPDSGEDIEMMQV